MQCVATATPHLPLFGASNSKAKLSQIQFRRNPNGYEEDGDGSEVSLLPLTPHVKSITSTSKPFVKHCVKLRLSSSYRHSHGSVLVVCTTPVRSDEFYFVFFPPPCFPLNYVFTTHIELGFCVIVSYVFDSRRFMSPFMNFQCIHGCWNLIVFCSFRVTVEIDGGSC